MKLISLFCLAALSGNAQWRQWGQNPRHTGTVSVAAQKPAQTLGQFTYDPLADQMRQDSGGNLLVHYMTPLLDGDEVFTLSRGESKWVSCRDNPLPCGIARWGQMQWGVTKLRNDGGALLKQWTAMSTWTPPPNVASGWEPVFHPALFRKFLYVPAASGAVMKLDRRSGKLIDTLQPFAESDPARFVTSPLTIDAHGSIHYTVVKLNLAEPWTTDAQGAWLVKIDSTGRARTVSFAELAPAQDACTGTFTGEPLPWPPSPDSKPPAGPCGSQRPGLNAAPAVGLDGTIYVISRAHLNSAYAYLTAVNADLTPKWSATLRGRLNDGCGVLLPPSGTLGGCRAGSLYGVDPTTNESPAGRVLDESTASPVIAPDGSVLYGAATRYNYARGHLFHFSPDGAFLGAYDFGWDITPAIFEHDGAWSVVLKDNHYGVGSYCGVVGQCGEAEASYKITSLDSNLRPEWSYENTNDQACERQTDGSISCKTSDEKFEWCVNMVAVDRNGVVYANSEDGNVYAIDKTGALVGRTFLKLALGAAYTPLAIGADGLVYTQNDGTLFVIGGQNKSPTAAQRR